MSDSLPYRFRESAFKRYSQLILGAVQSHPSPFRIRCNLYNLSPVTMSCRMRDAMKSLAMHKWPTPDWPAGMMDKFLKVHADLVISEDHVEEAITVTNKSAIRSPAFAQLVAPATQPILPTSPSLLSQTTPITLTTPDQKILLCHLAHYRLLSQPVKLLGITPEDINQYEQQYDVSIELDSSGVATLI